MALPTLSLAPSLPLALNEEPAVKEMSFGDGYGQRARDGINADRWEVSVTWQHMTLAEKDTIIDFLRAREGVDAFSMVVQGTTGTWIASQWGSTKTSGSSYTVTAQLKRVYDV